DIAALMAGQRFMLLSPEGRYISHYLPERTLVAGLEDFAALQNSPDFPAALARLRARESGLDIVDGLVLQDEVISGNTWLFHMPLASTGWHLLTLEAESALTLPLREQINIALLGLSLTILLIFVLVWVT